jgi:hypothetical protein
MNIFKITSIFFLLIFFNGCVQTTTLVGPGMTLVTTGNFLQAGFQYGGNLAIKNETGKNSFEHLKDLVNKKNKDKKFKRKFSELVKKRFEITHKKLKFN